MFNVSGASSSCKAHLLGHENASREKAARTSWAGKAVRVLLAIALAITLCPLPQRAYADPLAAAEINTELFTESVDAAPMYRLYNKWTNEHFFTSDYQEYRGLVKKGWNDEKIGWYAPASGTPVYRLYNQWSGDHHFTTDKSEYNRCVKQGWTGEKVAFYSGGGSPVYRLFNKYVTSFYHHYTMSRSEYNTCIKNGWTDEKVGWYGYAEKPSQSTNTPSQPNPQPTPDPDPTPAPEPEPVYAPESYDYTVTYDSGSGDMIQGVLQQKKVVANTAKQLKLESAICEKSGYDHTSWNTKEDGSGIEYALGQQVGDISQAEVGSVDNTGASTTPNRDVTLYAQYTQRPYKAFFIRGSNVPVAGSSYDYYDEVRDPIQCDQNGMFTLPPNIYDYYLVSGEKNQVHNWLLLMDVDESGHESSAYESIKLTGYSHSIHAGWQEAMTSNPSVLQDGSVLMDVDRDYYFQPHFEFKTTWSDITLPQPNAATMNAERHRGQRFLGWSNSKESNTVDYPAGYYHAGAINYTFDGAARLYAVWEDVGAPSAVNYKVEHYQQKVNGASVHNDTNYTQESTETLTAKAGTSVSPEPKTYPGFKTPAKQTVTVAGDGTTVVKYYYDRNSYSVNIAKDSCIASVSGVGTYRYGQTVTVSATPGTNSLFARWAGDYTSTTSPYEFTMPARNVNLTAVSKPDPDKVKPIEVTPKPEPTDPDPEPSEEEPKPSESVTEVPVGDPKTIKEGFYMLVNCANENLYLDVDGASVSNGANIQIFPGTKYTQAASANDAQVFYIQPSGVKGYYKINNAKSAMAVDVAEGRSAVGSNIQQWEYSGNTQELWQAQIGSIESSAVFVSKLNTNRVLGVSSTNPAAGANVELCERNYSASQSWKLIEIEGYDKLPAKTTLPTGQLFLKSVARGDYLGAANEYAPACTSSRQDGQQVWNAKAVPGGYQLANQFWGYVALDQKAEAASTLQTWDTANVSNQIWNAYPSFWGGIMLVPNSGRNMAVYRPEKGTTPKIGRLSVSTVANKAYAWKPMTTSSTYQRAPVPLTAGTSLLKSGVTAGLNYNLALPPNTASGTQVLISAYRNSNMQRWDVSVMKNPVPKTGGGFFKNEPLYKFKNVYTKKVLDADANSTKVQQWDANSSNNQLWVARRSTVKGQFVLVNYFYNRALDVSGGVAVEAGPTVTWPQNGTAAQNWVQEKVGQASDYPLIYHDDMARELFREYNNFRATRANNGRLDPAIWSDTCAAWAKRSAEYCANTGRLDHRMNDSPEWPTTILKINGQSVPRPTYFDILAYDKKLTAYEMIEKWRIDEGKDGGHRRMMQCATTKHAGAAVIEKNNTYYYVIVYDYDIYGTSQGGY